ncbi:hypothetical protein M8J75_012966 [Diaphorina citri]|nr:hypothetical protein M8J75_012966 [Diaphorina citri]
MKFSPSILYALLPAFVLPLFVSGLKRCGIVDATPDPTYHLIKPCSRSKMTLVGSANTKTLQQCQRYASTKKALALNYNPSGDFTDEPSCLLFDCPEFQEEISLTQDDVYDYYSLYADPMPDSNVSCVPKVGMFKLHTEKMNFTAAQDVCEEEGGYLANVLTEQKTNALSALIASVYSGRGKHMVYVGLHDMDMEGQAWAPNHPRSKYKTEDCVVLTTDKNWKVVNCTQTMPFLCELMPRGPHNLCEEEPAYCELGDGPPVIPISPPELPTLHPDGHLNTEFPDIIEIPIPGVPGVNATDMENEAIDIKNISDNAGTKVKDEKPVREQEVNGGKPNRTKPDGQGYFGKPDSQENVQNSSTPSSDSESGQEDSQTDNPDIGNQWNPLTTGNKKPTTPWRPIQGGNNQEPDQIWKSNGTEGNERPGQIGWRPSTNPQGSQNVNQKPQNSWGPQLTESQGNKLWLPQNPENEDPPKNTEHPQHTLWIPQDTNPEWSPNKEHPQGESITKPQKQKDNEENQNNWRPQDQSNNNEQDQNKWRPHIQNNHDQNQNWRPQDQNNHEENQDNWRPQDQNNNEENQDNWRPQDQNNNEENQDNWRPQDQNNNEENQDNWRPQDQNNHEENQDNWRPQDQSNTNEQNKWRPNIQNNHDQSLSNWRPQNGNNNEENQDNRRPQNGDSNEQNENNGRPQYKPQEGQKGHHLKEENYWRPQNVETNRPENEYGWRPQSKPDEYNHDQNNGNPENNEPQQDWRPYVTENNNFNDNTWRPQNSNTHHQRGCNEWVPQMNKDEDGDPEHQWKPGENGGQNIRNCNQNGWVVRGSDPEKNGDKNENPTKFTEDGIEGNSDRVKIPNPDQNFDTNGNHRNPKMFTNENEGSMFRKNQTVVHMTRQNNGKASVMDGITSFESGLENGEKNKINYGNLTKSLTGNKTGFSLTSSQNESKHKNKNGGIEGDLNTDEIIQEDAQPSKPQLSGGNNNNQTYQTLFSIGNRSESERQWNKNNISPISRRGFRQIGSDERYSVMEESKKSYKKMKPQENNEAKTNKLEVNNNNDTNKVRDGDKMTLVIVKVRDPNTRKCRSVTYDPN